MSREASEALPSTTPADRLRRLEEGLEADGLDGLLVASVPNLAYLSGFTGSEGILLVRRGADPLLLVDGRYGEQAEEEAGGTVVSRVVSNGLVRGLSNHLAGTANGARLGFEAGRLTVRAFEELEEALPGVSWRPTTGRVEALRARKDPGEIDRLRRAARTAAAGLEATLPTVREGMTELELVAELEYRLRKAGSGPPPFETIVASGPRSALPHACPGHRKLCEGDLLLLDFGATVEGYASDLTRTLVLGGASPWQRRIHGAVEAALGDALSVLAAGTPAREVDAAARTRLEEEGLGARFTHSVGHGLGLEVHEAPSLGRRSEAVLEEGHVVTIEPGVYLRGRGGVRLEENALVGPDGHVLLVGLERDLREL